MTEGFVLGPSLGPLEASPVARPEGFGDGTALRKMVGLLLGDADDPDDGNVLLWNDGVLLMILLGRREGGVLGYDKGTCDCNILGVLRGVSLGLLEATVVGCSEGLGDGTALRTMVG